MPGMLWINCIMDVISPILLAGDPSSMKVMARSPERRASQIPGFACLKMIIAQAVFQMAVEAAMLLLCAADADYTTGNSLVFNTLVFMLIFSFFK